MLSSPYCAQLLSTRSLSSFLRIGSMQLNYCLASSKEMPVAAKNCLRAFYPGSFHSFSFDTTKFELHILWNKLQCLSKSSFRSYSITIVPGLQFRDCKDTSLNRSVSFFSPSCASPTESMSLSSSPKKLPLSLETSSLQRAMSSWQRQDAYRLCTIWSVMPRIQCQSASFDSRLSCQQIQYIRYEELFQKKSPLQQRLNIIRFCRLSFLLS